jgi:hypothetical protein
VPESGPSAAHAREGLMHLEKRKPRVKKAEL